MLLRSVFGNSTTTRNTSAWRNLDGGKTPKKWIVAEVSDFQVNGLRNSVKGIKVQLE
jgi:hypothetical protein